MDNLNQYAVPDKLFPKFFQLFKKLYKLDQILRKKHANPL